MRLPDLPFNSRRPECREHSLPLLLRERKAAGDLGLSIEMIWICPSEQHEGEVSREDRVMGGLP
jgi:hypothetical protein